tara:strand:+ start:716 stop:1096 length:381 start_codon:yes stop_codon:yes gene_type:complete
MMASNQNHTEYIMVSLFAELPNDIIMRIIRESTQEKRDLDVWQSKMACGVLKHMKKKGHRQTEQDEWFGPDERKGEFYKCFEKRPKCGRTYTKRFGLRGQGHPSTLADRKLWKSRVNYGWRGCWQQ